MKMMTAKTGMRVLWALLAMVILFSGCTAVETGTAATGQERVDVDTSLAAAAQGRVPSTPMAKPGGGKFRIAYVDIDEYPVSSGMWFEVVESLRRDGWITCEDPPMTVDTADAKKLVDWLAKQDLGPYIEFVGDANYYLAYEGEEAVGKSLVDHAKNRKDIDLVFAMGTWPARFVKSLELGVPLLVYGSIDPVRAGIVASAEDSGYDDIWAQVDPSAFSRQLQFYHDTIPFTNIGMVFNDEIIASIPDYEKTAEADSFRITKVKIEKLASDIKEDQDKYYENLAVIYKRLIEEDKVDAYLINTDVITDDTRIDTLFAPFLEARIPIFVQVGDNYIRHGAFMQVSPRDYKGLGAFISNRIGSFFNGAKLRSLTQAYTSSPYLSLNLDVAERIGFSPSFEMLLSCGYIYTKEAATP